MIIVTYTLDNRMRLCLFFPYVYITHWNVRLHIQVGYQNKLS